MSCDMEPFCDESYSQGKAEGLVDGIAAALLLARSTNGTVKDLVDRLEQLYMEAALQ